MKKKRYLIFLYTQHENLKVKKNEKQTINVHYYNIITHNE
jgi:hypothetical protein